MIDRLIERRTTVLLISLVILVVSAFGLRWVSIDPNNRVFFSPSHPRYADLLDLEAAFGSNTELMFVLSSEASLADSSEFAEAITWMTERAWSIDQVLSVDSLATFPKISAEIDGLHAESFLEFACIKDVCNPERLGSSPLPELIGRLVSHDLRAAAIVARVDLGWRTEQNVLEIAAQAAELKSLFREVFPDIAIHLTGGVPMMEAFFDAAANDSALLMPIALIVIFVTIGFFLGSFLQSLLLVSLGFASVLITLGLAGWLGYSLNTATATAPLVIFTLVVAGSMHLFMHVAVSHRGADALDVSRRVQAATKANWLPMLLTAVTTAIGFGSMISVSAPPVRELGAMAAFGVLVGAALTLVVMPGIFVSWPRTTISKIYVDLQVPINAYAKWTERVRSKSWLVIGAVLISLWGLSKVDFDEDFVRYFSADAPFRADTEQISKVLAGPYHIDLIFDSGRSGGVYSSEALADIDAISEYLRADSRVVNVFSVADVLRNVSSVISPGSDMRRASSELLAQYFLAYELSLDRGHATTDLIDADHRLVRISVLLRDVSMGEIRDLVEGAEGWTKRHMPSRHVIVTGEGVPTAYLSGESISEMSKGMLISMAACAVLVAVILRSCAVGIVVLIATVVPLLAGFGVWGWLDGEIGMAVTLVIATTIGVVVDDTIHLAYRYIDGRRMHELTSWGAAAYSVHKTGPALVATSVALMIGFVVLVLSDFRMNSVFGICTALVIGFALVFNMSVSPRLLRYLV